MFWLLYEAIFRLQFKSLLNCSLKMASYRSQNMSLFWIAVWRWLHIEAKTCHWFNYILYNKGCVWLKTCMHFINYWKHSGDASPKKKKKGQKCLYFLSLEQLLCQNWFVDSGQICHSRLSVPHSFVSSYLLLAQMKVKNWGHKKYIQSLNSSTNFQWHFRWWVHDGGGTLRLLKF